MKKTHHTRSSLTPDFQKRNLKNQHQLKPSRHMAVQRTDWHNTQRTNTLAPDPLRCRLSKISIENLTHMPIGKTSFLPFLSGPIQHAQCILRPVWGTPPDIRGPGLLGQFKCRVYMHLVDLNMQLMYTGVVPDPLFFLPSAGISAWAPQVSGSPVCAIRQWHRSHRVDGCRGYFRSI